MNIPARVLEIEQRYYLLDARKKLGIGVANEK